MLFTKDHLKETFPWMKVDDIELASYGVQHEGWFDPTSLVNAFKVKIKFKRGRVIFVHFYLRDIAYVGSVGLSVALLALIVLQVRIAIY